MLLCSTEIGIANFDNYFWLKLGGSFTVAICLKCNSWASQKGSSTFEPGSTWNTNPRKYHQKFINKKKKKKKRHSLTVQRKISSRTYRIRFGTGINANPIDCLLEHDRNKLWAKKITTFHNKYTKIGDFFETEFRLFQISPLPPREYRQCRSNSPLPCGKASSCSESSPRFAQRALIHKFGVEKWKNRTKNRLISKSDTDLERKTRIIAQIWRYYSKNTDKITWKRWR